MKLFKITFLSLLCIALGSCLEDEPLTNESDQQISISNVQNELSLATAGTTPASMLKNEFAYFRYYARLYTGLFQGMGYQTYQVLERNPGTLTLEDGTIVDLAKFEIVETNYDEPANPGDPLVPQAPIEWKKDYALDPYNVWVSECDLAPYQNFLLYNNVVDQGQKIFFNFKKYKKMEKLPVKLLEENRCYNFKDCEVEVTYIEFDLIVHENGARRRLHISNGFTKEFPYLASNPKQCITTLVNIDGQNHPYEICRELVNFIPGE